VILSLRSARRYGDPRYKTTQYASFLPQLRPQLTSPLIVKEHAEISSKGTPPGIVLRDAESMEMWVFLISVLGDETVYRVSMPKESQV